MDGLNGCIKTHLLLKTFKSQKILNEKAFTIRKETAKELK
jgi:hypothetical protein